MSSQLAFETRSKADPPTGRMSVVCRAVSETGVILGTLSLGAPGALEASRPAPD